jgi:hypothetical protein
MLRILFWIGENYDSIDKGDTITIKVLKKWDSNELSKGIKYLIENRGLWVKEMEDYL